jgi:hypothetical protein
MNTRKKSESTLRNKSIITSNIDCSDQDTVTIDQLANSINIINNNIDLKNHLLDQISSQVEVSNYSQRSYNVLAIRGNIIDWLLVLTDKIKSAQETFFKAIMLFDTYISKIIDNEELDPKQLHFIAVICFFISYKFEETGVMTVDFVEKNLLYSKFTPKEIVMMETKILITINFKIKFPTLNTFSNILAENIKNIVKDKNFVDKFNCINTFVNKISLFVDEFIFECKPFNISLINFHTTLIIMKDLGLISDSEFFILDNSIKTLAIDQITSRQIDVLALGLYKAIVHQEKNKCHENLFFNYYSNINQILGRGVDVNRAF